MKMTPMMRLEWSKLQKVYDHRKTYDPGPYSRKLSLTEFKELWNRISSAAACPYQREINDNDEPVCNCCEECCSDCVEDI
jgi:hypothetical protein